MRMANKNCIQYVGIKVHDVTDGLKIQKMCPLFFKYKFPTSDNRLTNFQQMLP